MLLAATLAVVVHQWGDALETLATTHGSDGVVASLLALRVLHAERCLLRAARDGDERLVRLLVAANRSIDASDELGHDVVLVAAHHGHASIVRELLTNRQPAALRDASRASGESRNTPLHESANAGRSKTTELLLALKADVNARNNVGNTPLHFATAGGHERDTQLLLAAGADRAARNAGLETPFAIASGAALEYLYRKYFPLHAAAKGNSLDRVAELLDTRPALVDTRDHNNATALHWAALNGHGDIADMLIEAKASLNLRDKNDWTPLVGAMRARIDSSVSLCSAQCTRATAQRRQQRLRRRCADADRQRRRLSRRRSEQLDAALPASVQRCDPSKR